MFNLDALLRDNIRRLVPYSSARDEFRGQAAVFLDANENSFGSPVNANYHRYPDPLQSALKEKLSRIKGVPVQNMFLGNGSDEAIDILFRAFCEPGKDNVILLPPTYGMYEVSATINDVEVRKAVLRPDFQLDPDAIAELIDERTKLLFVCSPNNPTGNSIEREDIEMVLNNFEGLVVIDEAYINFARQKTFIAELQEYPNLVILQTLSKAWGLAGLRLGMAFASEGIIEVFNKVKPPYNVSSSTQQLALEALENVEQVNEWIRRIVGQREELRKLLPQFSFVKKIFPSDANFLLVQVEDARRLYGHLVQHGIVVRDRSKIILCEGCLRITVGTEEENRKLLEALAVF